MNEEVSPSTNPNAHQERAAAATAGPEVAPTATPPTVDSHSNHNSDGLVRFLYNQNPFYLVSACLILHGIRTTLQTDQSSLAPWVLASVFLAYTTLLAITSFLIVKWGSVWDDARSIFMVLLLLFLAVPVGLDSLVRSAPSTISLLLAGVFLFAVLVTECLTRGLGIGLPTRFRIPYYAMLAIGILYPIVISAQLQFAPQFDTRWTLAGFPLLCAAAILSLIPAARKNRKYVLKNGTPWHWPLFPYSVFTLLIVGLCGRVYLITLAFDPSVGDGSIFGGYLLAPIYLAVLMVVLEIAITERMKELQTFVLASLPLCIPMSANWSDLGAPVYFLASLNSVIGSPVWLATLVVVGIYLVAVLRRVESAHGWLLLGLALASMIHQDGSRASWITELETWPLIAISGFVLIRREDRQRSYRWLTAATVLTIPILRSMRLQPTLNELVAEMPNLPLLIGAHWLLLAALLIGIRFDDHFAKKIRVILGVVMPLFALIAVLVFALRPSVQPMLENHPSLAWLPIVYAVCLAAICVASYFAMHLRLYLYSGLSCILIAIAACSSGHSIRLDGEYRWLIIYSAIGLGCFAAGVMISCAKAGFGNGIGDRLRLEWERLLAEFGTLVETDEPNDFDSEPSVEASSPPR